MVADLYRETFPIPRAVRFPVELRPPPGFNPLDATTWPRVDGRLEYVNGKLIYMPPCGDVQQDLAVRVAGLIDRWLDDHPDFVAGANEAGMLLGGDVRGADAAIWRRGALGPHTGGYRRVPPLLVVKIAGADEDEASLREKVAWYFGHGVAFAWLVLPATRELVVLRAAGGEKRLQGGDAVPTEPELPGLALTAEAVFSRLK
jgi:Uma2 family endonuclease